MKRKQDDPVAEKAAPELTRREWLLRLGEITALAGVAGLVPEVATTLAGAGQPVAVALPPGLYEPSPKHLIHALSGQGAAAIPPGSETDYVQPRPGPFHPQFFSPEEFRMVTRLVEVLLGTVDASALAEAAEWIDLRIYSAAGAREAARRLDPLHRALAVAYYGEASVLELETSDPQSAARAGMGALAEHCQARFAHAFLELPPSGQVDVVREISQAPQESSQRRFYNLLHREAIRGYYTSRRGLRELDYEGNSYHVQCPGCEKT